MKPRRHWPLPMDLTGRQYGQWAVLGPGTKHKFWQCRCACGTEREVCGSNLRGGLSRSCGCVKDRKTSERMRTHGRTGTRLYRAWRNMRERCLNPNRPDFHHYGGRGIGVCAEWSDYAAFETWALMNGYKDTLTLDRIDGGKGYGPDNCRWATRATQALNRDCVKTMPDGTPAITVARRNGIGVRTYISRLRYGWTPQEAATVPVRSLRKRA